MGVALYRYNLSEQDFRDLAERLRALRGWFLLSINDCPLARDLFRDFHCREVTLAHTATRSVPSVQELIFTNYEAAPEKLLDGQT